MVNVYWVIGPGLSERILKPATVRMKINTIVEKTAKAWQNEFGNYFN